MGNFLNWLCESATINYDPLKKALSSIADKMIESAKERDFQLSVFNVDEFFRDIATHFSDYPNLNSLLKSLKSEDRNHIWEETKKVRDWINNKPYSDPKADQLRVLQRKIYTVYADFINKKDNLSELKEKEVHEYVNKSMTETQKNMEEIKKQIEEAISRIPNWNGENVHIIALASHDEYGHSSIQATNSAEVKIGDDRLSPSFTLFKSETGKLEIDDVLEGGDTDFFHTPQMHADYFNLINELKKPGSTNKGKVLTLYTARPKSHRTQLMHSPVLPVNIFLVNDYDHAEGLAIDLGGSEQRDIWKVKIDSRYLTQTLDGRIKYYQVTVENAPVKMELLS
jgi:hypothetical protein